MLRQQGRVLLHLAALDVRLANGATGQPLVQTPAVPMAGLPIGTRAPGFRLSGLRGETLTLDALLATLKPVLMLFTNPHCGPCEALMPHIARWQQEHSARLTIALVSEGTAEDNRIQNVVQRITHVLVQQKREVAEAYKAYGTPAAVLISQEGIINSPLAQGADAIRALVTQIVGAAPKGLSMADALALGNGQNKNGSRPFPSPLGAKLGDPAPPLTLQDLNGNTVELAAFLGRKTLLLFWNPGCGFCQQMLNDLRAWESDPPLLRPSSWCFRQERWRTIAQ